MNVLVTSSRMPFALDEIRKFGRRGHRVFAADTFRAAPGSHSRYVTAHMTVASPQRATSRFLTEVQQIIQHRQVDLLVPCFEEAFYLARHHAELSQVTHLFTSDFEALSQLHHKWRFNRLARELGIAAPETLLVESAGELEAGLRAWPYHVARPAWSRGGLDVLTNAGPLAGAVALDECRPTPAQPWIVQPYVEGVDVCSFSVARHGRVTVHCTYVHPLEIEHAGGIVFESIVEPATLAVVERLVEALGYHGQIGVDFRRIAGGGLVALECNPRPTAGVHLVLDEQLVDAVLAPPVARPWVVPAGTRRKYASAVLRDLLLHGTRLRQHLAVLLSRSAGDVYGEPGDWLPALYQVLSYANVLAYRTNHGRPLRRGTSLMAAYLDGVAWNGEPIPMSATALVLGAGGVAARAFHAGVLRALVEVCDWNPQDADLILGTSAGAQIGALLRAGVPAAALYQQVLADPLAATQSISAARAHRRWPASPAYLRAMLRHPWRARPMRLAAALLPEGASEKGFSPVDSEWPARPLWITAVDIDDGARVVFGRAAAPHTDVATAVCCSSSVPGLSRPVSVGGRRYVDGAIASPTHLDLLDGEQASLAVVLSPLSRFATLRLRLRAEIYWLRRRGVRAVVFEPDAPVKRAMGWNPFNPRAATAIATAAYRDAVRELTARGDLRALLTGATPPVSRSTSAITPAAS